MCSATDQRENDRDRERGRWNISQVSDESLVRGYRSGGPQQK
jgi:hypothetical protein